MELVSNLHCGLKDFDARKPNRSIILLIAGDLTRKAACTIFVIH
jgi:hypothetical protein